MTAPQPTYGHTVHLAGVSFVDAKARITDALKQEGFGILTEIDVKETLRKKLEQEFRSYVILGACNPGLAYRGLRDELALGLLLPCNVCVWEDEGGSTVSVLRPDKMVEITGNPKLAPMAAEANAKLQAALRRLQA